MFGLEQRGAKSASANPGTEASAQADTQPEHGVRGGGPGGTGHSVVITTDGSVLIDGLVIKTAASGDTAQTAVLDLLHQRALSLSSAVDASILDQQQRVTLHIRVREDGASELLSEPVFLDTVEASPPPVPPAPSSTPSTGPLGKTDAKQDAVPDPNARPEQGATQRDQDTTILTAVEPVRPTVRPGPEALPGSRQQAQAPLPPPPLSRPAAQAPMSDSVSDLTPLPEELVAGVALVCETAAVGDLALARAHASALERQAARRFGPEHLYTLEALALEAYTAHLTGEHASATALALQVAEARHRQGNSRAKADIERAVAYWELTTSPFAAMSLGNRLLPLWKLIGASEDGDRYSAAERRLATLSRVTPPAFAAALKDVL